jgi:hypothetical protein
MSWGRALKHPLGIALLAASAMLVALVTADVIEGGREGWLLAWGFAGYATVVAYVAWREREASVDPAPAPLPVVDSAGAPIPPDIVSLTDAALRHLGSPAFLASCGLIAQLPYTIAAGREEAGKTDSATPLDNANVLRAVLTRSVEKLRQVEGEAGFSEKESLQYHILHEHYVGSRPATYTMTRHSIAEATFHRYRREAVRAVAADLAAQEQMLARAPSAAR